MAAASPDQDRLVTLKYENEFFLRVTSRWHLIARKFKLALNHYLVRFSHFLLRFLGSLYQLLIYLVPFPISPWQSSVVYIGRHLDVIGYVAVTDLFTSVPSLGFARNLHCILITVQKITPESDENYVNFYESSTSVSK